MSFFIQQNRLILFAYLFYFVFLNILTKPKPKLLKKRIHICIYVYFLELNIWWNCSSFQFHLVKSIISIQRKFICFLCLLRYYSLKKNHKVVKKFQYRYHRYSTEKTKCTPNCWDLGNIISIRKIRIRFTYGILPCQRMYV